MKDVKHTLLIAILGIALGITNIAVCEGGITDEKTTEMIGEEIIVTASRSESKRSDCGVAVDVITKEDIERTNAKTLTDVLKKCSSIDVVEYPGGLSVVNLRGFAPELFTNIKHHALLIDGRRAGAINLSTIPSDNVERIEVLKGPASSLYGAEAMAGVINVITKRSSGKIEARSYIEGGEFGLLKLNLQSGGAINEWLDFDVSITDEKRGNYVVPGYKVNNWEWKGGVWKGNNHSNKAMSGRLGFGTRDHRLDIRAEEFKGKMNNAGDIYGNYGPGKNDRKRASLELSYERKTENHSQLAKAFQAEDKTFRYDREGEDWYKSFLAHSDYKGLQAQNTIKFTPHELTIGVDYNFDKNITEAYKSDGSQIAPYRPNDEKINWAGFFEGRLSFGSLIITIGGRYDHYKLNTIETPYLRDYSIGSEELSSFNPRGSLLYKVNNNLSFRSSIGSAFVIPNPLQKAGSYIYWGKTYKGNLDLKPEKSLTYDIGLRVAMSPFNLDLTYFHTDLKDKIAEKKLGAREFTYENIEEAEMEGIENDLSFDIGRFLRLYSKLTYLTKAKDITQDKDIYNVAKMKMNYGIDYRNKWLNGRLSFRHVGKMRERNYFKWGAVNPYGPVDEIEYGDFTLTDLNLSYKVTKNLIIDLRVNNLFDKAYEEKPGYPMSGRTFYGGLKLDF